MAMPRLNLPLERIRRLYESGRTLVEIAALFKVAPTVIHRRLQEMGVPTRTHAANNIRAIGARVKKIKERDKP